jgi:DNA polymerase III delta prime subunit
MNSDKILVNSLKSQNTPNLLLYGHGGYDKCINTLNSIYTVTEKKKILSGDINYYKTNIYYEFNTQSIISKNYKNFIEIINEIINYKDYFTGINYKIIILNNFNRIKSYLQNIFRVIIEKYRETTVFICMTNNYNSIIEPLRSRFLCIRFPQITNKDKRKILYQNIKPSEIDKKYYDFVYTQKDKSEIELSLEVKDEIDRGYIDPYHLLSRRIINIYENKKYNKKIYESLKDISYNSIKFNLEISKFYKIFLSELLQKQTIRDKQKYELVKLFADSEYHYNKSYRSIIVLESLLFHVYNLCYNL